MRYIKGQKDETKQKIKAKAAELFRQDGINATGIAGLMGACGLTNGAFYVHFESKDDLVREALGHALEQRLEALDAQLAKGASGVEAAMREYLSMAHVKGAGAGCATAALAPEVARASAKVRSTYTKNLAQLLDRIGQSLPSSARDSAPALFGMLVGCVQLARASNDKALSRQILDSGLKTALAFHASLLAGH